MVEVRVGVDECVNHQCESEPHLADILKCTVHMEKVTKYLSGNC